MRLTIGCHYRPIEGEASGEIIDIDIIKNMISWAHKDRVFIIPYERFVEYFCEAEVPVIGS